MDALLLVGSNTNASENSAGKTAINQNLVNKTLILIPNMHGRNIPI